MRCPRCQRRAEVYDSRPSDGRVWRRRKCTGCGFRFTTWEMGVLKQRDRALEALRAAGFTVREIAEIVGLSENYVGQKTKAVKVGSLSRSEFRRE